MWDAVKGYYGIGDPGWTWMDDRGQNKEGKMTDYTELVKALRICSSELNCGDCPLLYRDSCSSDELMADAAAAIEELQAQVESMDESCKKQLAAMASHVAELQAEVKRLNMRCADCEYASKPWPELEPKRGEFEKSLHEMFDSIWDCDINHPIFQDTVGELMEAVLQAYDTVNRAKMEVQDGKD